MDMYVLWTIDDGQKERNYILHFDISQQGGNRYYGMRINQLDLTCDDERENFDILFIVSANQNFSANITTFQDGIYIIDGNGRNKPMQKLFSTSIIEGDTFRIAVAQNATYTVSLHNEIAPNIPNPTWLPINEQPLQVRTYPWERHGIVYRTLSDWQPAFAPFLDADDDLDINDNNIDPLNGQQPNGNAAQVGNANGNGNGNGNDAEPVVNGGEGRRAANHADPENRQPNANGIHARNNAEPVVNGGEGRAANRLPSNANRMAGDPVNRQPNRVGNRVDNANSVGRRPRAYISLEEMRRQILANGYVANQDENENEHDDEELLQAVLEYEHSQQLQEEYNVSPEVALAIVHAPELLAQPERLRQLSQNLANENN